MRGCRRGRGRGRVAGIAAGVHDEARDLVGPEEIGVGVLVAGHQPVEFAFADAVGRSDLLGQVVGGGFGLGLGLARFGQQGVEQADLGGEVRWIQEPNIPGLVVLVPPKNRSEDGVAGFAGEEAGLGLVEVFQELAVVGHGFLDELFEEEDFGAVDDGVDALLKGLQRIEGLEGIADEHDGGVTAAGHGHLLQGVQGGILGERVGAEKFFHDDDLIFDAAEADMEIAVGGGGVDLVAEFFESGARGVHPFGRGEGDERRFIGGTDEFKVLGHGLF